MFFLMGCFITFIQTVSNHFLSKYIKKPKFGRVVLSFFYNEQHKHRDTNLHMHMLLHMHSH